MKSIFEELGGTYTLGEDGMYYPNLELPVEEEPHYGKYGRMRMNYIKEHRPGLYTELLFDGKLVSHLNDIDDTARQRMELLTRQMLPAFIAAFTQRKGISQQEAAEIRHMIDAAAGKE